MKFASMIKSGYSFKWTKIICGIILFLSYNSVFGAEDPEIIPYPDKKGFTLNFEGTKYFESSYSYTSDFSNPNLLDAIKAKVVHVPSGDFVENYGINFVFYCAGNDSPLREFGIVKDEYTKFIITQNDKNYFIESIEIKWADIDKAGGGLTLYTSNSYSHTEASKGNNSNILKSSTKLISLVPERGQLVKYDIATPVNLIAIFHYRHEDSNNSTQIAAFESLKINFAEEAPAERISLNAHLGDIDIESELLNEEWRNHEMVISSGMSFEGADKKEIELQDINFYLEPQFEISEKPDASDGADKPDYMINQAWRLYKVLEQSDGKYDGFLTTKERIDCGVATGSFEYFSLMINPPCSGRYLLTAESNNPKYVLKTNSLDLNIYPGISNTYEWLAEKEENGYEEDAIYRFGLNWVNYDGSGILSYPHDFYEEGKPHAHDKGILFVPGLYNAEIYYKLTFNNIEGGEGEFSRMAKENLMADEDGFYPYEDETSFNLSDLQDEAYLELKIKKNNAETPLNQNTGKSETAFSIKLSDSSFNVALGIKESEENVPNEVEFYDLKGIKIKPLNMTKGVYIKKEGSKVSKVIL